MNRLLILFLILLSIELSAQLTENFSDGDFTSNPVWTGTDSQFKINSGFQLQLNSSVADTSYLSTSNSFFGEMEWRFLVKLTFNPSSNNLARIYLSSSQSNIESVTNAYYVELGNTADNVSLFRQDGNTHTKIINGSIASLNSTSNILNVKVIRTATGNWTLYTDASGGNNFVSEGSGNDVTYSSTSFFGVFCKYTVSNSTKFFFDDIYIGPIQLDTIAPVLVSGRLVSNSVIELTYNEILDSNSCNILSNYLINPLNPALDSARLDMSNKNKVYLYFHNSFSNGTIIQVQSNQISDINGNISGIQSIQLTYYIAKQYDIVINEIMADPDPAVAMPNAEFVELKNNSAFDINLTNWKFQYGTTIKNLNSGIIEAGGYILLCYQDDSSMFSTLGNFIPLSGLSLTNTGMQLILLDDFGNIVHQVYYQDSWYADNNKKNGGWSLEMIDSKNPCGCETNYKASANLLGGTPGLSNSVMANNPDIVKPEIVRLILPDSMSVKIIFSESLDSSKIKNLSNYFVDKTIGYPVTVFPSYPDYKSAVLTFSKVFQAGLIYTLEINDSIFDCYGNCMDLTTTSQFALPTMATKGEILINEILFNPNDDGVDFVELYNNSDKVFDLKQMRLSNWNSINSIPENVYEITTEGFLFFPKTYIVLSTKPEMVRSQYTCGDGKYFCQTVGLPSMSNESGSIALLKSSLEELDFFEYSEEMQFGLLQSVEGVSLERIRFDYSSQDKSNWHSASESCGFGTPALKNSQFLSSSQVIGEIKPEPEVFSPDNDGFQDVLSIHYNFENAGFTANVLIYNSAGQEVRVLIKNELTATSGIWTWDGLTDKGEKLPYGIYILYTEIFDLKGNVNKYKQTIVLGGKL